MCETDTDRRSLIKNLYPDVTVATPDECKDKLYSLTDRGGADRVIEVAGSDTTFEMAWRLARPNAIVTVVALYDRPQILPLPEMYGKNLTFKTGGVDGCDCREILDLIAKGKIDTTPLITHRFPLSEVLKAYDMFSQRQDHIIKAAIYPD